MKNNKKIYKIIYKNNKKKIHRVVENPRRERQLKEKIIKNNNKRKKLMGDITKPWKKQFYKVTVNKKVEDDTPILGIRNVRSKTNK